MAGNVVFFAAQTGLVQALETKTGSVRWSRQLDEGRINTPATPIQGQVFVGSTKKVLYRLDAATGAIERSLERRGLRTEIRRSLRIGSSFPFSTTGSCVSIEI